MKSAVASAGSRRTFNILNRGLLVLALSFSTVSGLMAPAALEAQASETAQLAQADEPVTISDWLNKALEAREIGDWDTALQAYSRVLNLNPEVAEAYVGRGFVFSEMKHYGDAVEDFSAAIELMPKESMIFVGRGLAYYYQDLDDQALADFNQALKLKPDNADALFHRGRLEAYHKRYQEAVADLSGAINLNANNAWGYFERAKSYVGLEQEDKALADYQKALELVPLYDRVYDSRGNLHLYKHRLAEALEDFTHAIQLDPEEADYFKHRSATYEEMGELNKALADLTAAYALTEENSLLNDMGLINLKLRKYPEAGQQFAAALESDPEDLDYHDSIGWYYLFSRKPEGAWPHFAYVVKEVDDKDIPDFAVWIENNLQTLLPAKPDDNAPEIQRLHQHLAAARKGDREALAQTYRDMIQLHWDAAKAD